MIVLYICITRVRVSVAHFPRDIMRSCCRVLACRALLYVYMYIDIVVIGLRSCYCAVLSAVPCGCGLLSAVPLSACFPSCAHVVLFVAVVIWCTRVTMRCNRFSVLDGVCSFTSCALVRLWYVLQAFTIVLVDGVRSCSSVPCRVGVGWRVLLSADGVRMRCIGLLYVDIYLYIVAVGVDCGAFSCSCGGVCACVYMYLSCGWWWCGCIYAYM